MVDNREAVARVIKAYGNDIRMDWSDLDGRSVKHILHSMVSYLADDAEPITYESLAARYDICPVEDTGYYWCSKKDPEHPYDLCGHVLDEPNPEAATPFYSTEVIESD